jgi:hypothetical protein
MEYAEPVCDTCNRKEECIFWCENRIDQFVKEEAEANQCLSPIFPIVWNCGNCANEKCKLKESGMTDLCNGSKFRGAKAAIEQQEVSSQSVSSSDEEITFMSYKGFNFKKRQPIEEAVTVVKMDRQVFKSKTIFPPGFPVPVVCKEFCDVHMNCHLRQNGFDDLCKNHDKFGKLVNQVDMKWSAWNDFKNRAPKTVFVRSTRTGTAPEIALAHWGSKDAEMSENCGEEYMSPKEQAIEYNDVNSIKFIPAFIFAAGKPVWRHITAFDKQGYPYIKMVKYPSIRAIACKVKLENGQVIPGGRAASSLKITTRADKKRIMAFSAIKKELTQYVSAERTGVMAGQQVAAMVTC